MYVIAIASQKGGVGKTTISLNLGLAFARAGRRTLILELDAQGSLGLSLGLPDRARPGIAEVLTGAEPLEAVLTRTRDPQLHVLSLRPLPPAQRRARPWQEGGRRAGRAIRRAVVESRGGRRQAGRGRSRDEPVTRSGACSTTSGPMFIARGVLNMPFTLPLLRRTRQ